MLKRPEYNPGSFDLYTTHCGGNFTQKSSTLWCFLLLYGLFISNTTQKAMGKICVTCNGHITHVSWSFLYDRKIDLYYYLITIPLSLSVSFEDRSEGWWNMKSPSELQNSDHSDPSCRWGKIQYSSKFPEIFFSSAAAGYINAQLNSLLQCCVNLQLEKPGVSLCRQRGEFAVNLVQDWCFC